MQRWRVRGSNLNPPSRFICWSGVFSTPLGLLVAVGEAQVVSLNLPKMISSGLFAYKPFTRTETYASTKGVMNPNSRTDLIETFPC